MALLRRQRGELDVAGEHLAAWPESTDRGSRRYRRAGSICRSRMVPSRSAPRPARRDASRRRSTRPSSAIDTLSRKSAWSAICPGVAVSRAGRGDCGISAPGRRCNQKAERRQQHLQEGVDADDAAVAARRQRHRLGGDGVEPARRRSARVGRYWPTDTAKPTAAAVRMAREQHRQADPRAASPAGSCRGRRRPPRSGGHRRATDRTATGRHRAGRRPDARGPAPAGWRRAGEHEQQLQAEQESDLRHDQRQVDEAPAPSARRSRPVSFSRIRQSSVSSSGERRRQQRRRASVVASGPAMRGAASSRSLPVSVCGQRVGKLPEPGDRPEGRASPGRRRRSAAASTMAAKRCAAQPRVAAEPPARDRACRRSTARRAVRGRSRSAAPRP